MRQQAGLFRRANNEPSARRGLAGGCYGHKILESRDEGGLGYASFESKSEIPGKNMIDHIILTVSDFERSIAFYEKALKPLGITTFIDYKGKDGHPDLKGFAEGKSHFFCYFFWDEQK